MISVGECSDARLKEGANISNWVLYILLGYRDNELIAPKFANLKTRT